MKRVIKSAGWTCVLALGIAGLQAQSPHKVDARNLYERCWATLPLVGAGTLADPKRPQYAPLASQRNPLGRTGILGFAYVLSDDGKTALVEFVARDRSAFQPILANNSPGVKAFIKGVHSRGAVESEFKKYKKDFDFDHFGIRMP